MRDMINMLPSWNETQSFFLIYIYIFFLVSSLPFGSTVVLCCCGWIIVCDGFMWLWYWRNYMIVRISIKWSWKLWIQQSMPKHNETQQSANHVHDYCDILYMGQVTKMQLSCYLVLLSTEGWRPHLRDLTHILCAYWGNNSTITILNSNAKTLLKIACIEWFRFQNACVVCHILRFHYEQVMFWVLNCDLHWF